MTAVLALLVAVSVPAAAVSVARKKQVARSQFETAERLREALSGRPAKERTRREYNRVIDAYRRVYYTAPTSSKADASVLAVAELLAETGRVFNDEQSFKGAIGQYEFLRREYPGSKHHIDALFTIGQIYREDLDDTAQAKATFEEFLKRYPRHRLADDARAAIQEMEAQAAAAKKKADAKESGKEAKETKDSKPPAAKTSGKLPLVTGIRHWSTPDYTRVAIDLERKVKYEAGRLADPDRIFFDLHDSKLAPELMGKSFEVEDGFLRKIRVAQYQRGMTRVVLEVDDVSEYSAFLLPNPDRLIVDIHGKPPNKTVAKAEAPKPAPPPSVKSAPAPSPPEAAHNRPSAKAKASTDEDNRDTRVAANSAKSKPVKEAETAKLAEPEVKATSKPTTSPTFESVTPRAESKRKKGRQEKSEVTAHEAKPTSSGERSLIRALGLKIGRIVVDAGHGGHDTGTIGPNGLEEKDLVLDVALRLGKLLENRMGAEVIYTRDDDTFVPLETRTAVANKNQADLFLSIHANSSNDPRARGVETYYLNFTSSADALEVAARENAVSEKSIHELQDLVKKIALKEKIEESREFAADVQHALHAGLTAKNPGLRDRGVRKAPFIVLIGANMPSILAEISFVSNPSDERKLKTPEYRQKIAEALYRGIGKYVAGLSGVKMATKMPKESGQ